MSLKGASVRAQFSKYQVSDFGASTFHIDKRLRHRKNVTNRCAGLRDDALCAGFIEF